MSNRKRKNPDWAILEKDCAKKRSEGKVEVRPKSANSSKINQILSFQELTVQRLYSELSGKIPNYAPLGPQVFVPYTEDDVTIEGIKSSCLRHFVILDPSVKNTECDILASERGPSCSNINQIRNVSLTHVRFVSRPIPTSTLFRSPFSRTDSSNQPMSSNRIHSRQLVSKSSSLVKQANPKPEKVPRSLSLTSMLKMGQTTLDNKDTVQISISEFKVHSEMLFEDIGDFRFHVVPEAFGRGAFRNVHMAICSSNFFSKGQWVVKRYNESAKHDIEIERNQSLKQHTRKAVQMTALSEYFASRLRSHSPNAPQFRYVKAYLREIQSSGEFVTIEQYIVGNFEKYLNNDGRCEGNAPVEINAKAECLAHFSLMELQERLLLTDIQGCGLLLTDPEIASAELIKDEEFLFCCGNFCRKAIKTFGLTHICNTFCRTVGLDQLDIEKFCEYDARIVLPNGEVIN